MKFPKEGAELCHLAPCCHSPHIYYTITTHTLFLQIECLFNSHSLHPHPWLQCSWKCVPHFKSILSASLSPSFLPSLPYVFIHIFLKPEMWNGRSWTSILIAEVTQRACQHMLLCLGQVLVQQNATEMHIGQSVRFRGNVLGGVCCFTEQSSIALSHFTCNSQINPEPLYSYANTTWCLALVIGSRWYLSHAECSFDVDA